MLRVKNYKRMLAYSSVENMGIMILAVGLGPVGLFAAMLQALAHSLSKTSLFLTSGNILHEYGTKKIESVTGLLKRDSVTGWIWIASFLSIVGIPPFPIFISKFFIIRAFWFDGQGWLAALFFLFIIVVTFGMGSAVFKMVFGESSLESADASKPGLSAYIPQIALLVMLLIIGINMPQQLHDMLEKAALFLSAGSGGGVLGR